MRPAASGDPAEVRYAGWMDPDRYRTLSVAVADTFVAAYPGYVGSRIRNLDVDPARIAGAIDSGHTALQAAFADWTGRSPHEQSASPLELFREALAAPTGALTELGLNPATRQEAQRRALPGDHYDLAPVTSRDLGDEAFGAHVAWGVARAEAIAGMVPAPPGGGEPSSAGTDRTVSTPQPGGEATVDRIPGRPVAVLVGADLMDRTRIAASAEQAGHELALWRNPAAISNGLAGRLPDVAFVDLRHAAANEAIRRLSAAGVRTVAFGPHVDDVALAAAGALGATEVLPRSRFFVRLPKLFATVV